MTLIMNSQYCSTIRLLNVWDHKFYRRLSVETLLFWDSGKESFDFVTNEV